MYSFPRSKKKHFKICKRDPLGLTVKLISPKLPSAAGKFQLHVRSPQSLKVGVLSLSSPCHPITGHHPRLAFCLPTDGTTETTARHWGLSYFTHWEGVSGRFHSSVLKRLLAETEAKCVSGKYLRCLSVLLGDQARGQMEEAKKGEFMRWEKSGKKESQRFCPAVPATAGHIRWVGGAPPRTGNTPNSPFVCVGRKRGRGKNLGLELEDMGWGPVDAEDRVGGGMAASVETEGSGLASEGQQAGEWARQGRCDRLGTLTL